MEAKLNLIADTEAWDARYNLPLFPKHNNPWIYLAYTLRVLAWDEERSGFPEWFFTAIADHFRKCEVLAGFLMRWPNGGMASHDEVMGAAYVSAEFSKRAVQFLSVRDGLYSLPGTPETLDDNFTRFVFLSPYLKAEAGDNVSWWSQLLFCLHVLDDAFLVQPGEVNGTLKIWLMAPAMRKFAWCKLALSIWAWRWTARGYTPKSIFRDIYLKEYPFLGEWAREDWT